MRMESYSEDKKLIIDAGAVAAGATVWSPVMTGLEWVRNILLMTSVDQNYDILYSPTDSGGISGSGITLVSGNTATGATWKPNPVSTVFGKGGSFGIKNTGATATTFAKMRIQLMGR